MPAISGKFPLQPEPVSATIRTNKQKPISKQSAGQERIKMEILVAYFSPTGTTAKVARTIADEVKADLFEIKPAKPYTAADLKWTNPLARCNREKILKKDVPCAERIINFSDYNTRSGSR